MTRAVLPLSFSFLYDNNIIFAKEQASQNFLQGRFTNRPQNPRISFGLPLLRERKRKNQNIFEKSSEHFSLQTPPILPLPQSPLPFFHQIAVKKVHARKTFFRIFKNFFRPKPSFFVFFKTFFRANADRVIPFHGEKARKTDNLHNPKFQKITLVWTHFPCEKRTQKNIQKNQKNFKKGVDILERVCYTT